MKKNPKPSGAAAPRPARYPLKVQAIRSQGQEPRLYVYFPLPLAAALGLGAGERVQWELLDRSELHLVRLEPPRAQHAPSGRCGLSRVRHPVGLRVQAPEGVSA